LWQNKRTDKFTGKSTWHTLREYVTLEIVAKYRNVQNLLALIEEIDYFTFSNNNDIVSSNEALPNSIFIFDKNGI